MCSVACNILYPAPFKIQALLIIMCLSVSVVALPACRVPKQR
jgi:hypothetical protein